MSALTDRLRPRSTEGSVYRDEWVERFEPIYYGFGLLIVSLSAVVFAVHGDWLAGAGFLAVIAGMMLVARFGFRVHLVVGDDALVLAGLFRTRRVPLAEVRKAVAAKGALKLVLVDGDEVYVPGHFLWSHARGDSYSYLADTINAQVVARAITPDPRDPT